MTQKTILLLTTITFGIAAGLRAEIIDEWTFDYPDGTGVGDALSLQGADWGANSGSNAVVFGGELQFQYDGVTASTFRNATPSSDAGSTAGRYQLSWTYAGVDFTLTHGTSATNAGRIGFGIRNTNNNNDVSLRLVGVGGEIILERSDADNSNVSLASFSGSTLSNLQVRLLFDFDQRGSAGSFQVFYTTNGGSEVSAVTDGTLPADFELSVIRMVQQTTNGGASWIPGDTVRVDNLVLETVIAEADIAGIRTVTATGLQFMSETGVVYALEYDEAGPPETWMPAGISAEGTGGALTLFDPAGYSTSRAYRVVIDQ